MYDQAYKVSFHQKVKSIQYNAILAITGAIRRTSREKLYHELGFKALVSRRWYHKLWCFYKVFKTKSPRYLFEVFIRPSESNIFLCNNPKGMQLLTRLRLGLSHLRDHRFKRNFQDTLNLISNCSEDIGTSCHYLLHCLLYTNKRLALLNVIQGIDNSILELTDSHIVEVLLYGRKFIDISSNANILKATIDFLLETKRFDERLF